MIINILCRIFNRLGIALIVAGVICYMLSDYKMITNAYVVRTLNRTIPSAIEYTAFITAINSDTLQENNRKIKAVNSYYKKITEFKPHITEAWGILGASYYVLNKPDQAIKAYSRALTQSPKFFWYSYNLGLIHLKNGDYQKAASSFQQAKNADDKTTAYKMLNSPMIYAPIIKNYRNLSTTQLRNEYIKARQSIPKLETYCYMKDNNTNVALQKATTGIKSDAPNKHFYLYVAAQNAVDNQNQDLAFNLAQNILKDDAFNIDALRLMKNIFEDKKQNKLSKRIDQEINKAQERGRKNYADQITSIRITPY